MSQRDPFEERWEVAAKDGRLADAIEDYIRQYDYVTFTELSRRLEPYFDLTGTMALEIAPNVILWLGMSEAFCDAINQLQCEKRIWPYPSSSLTYMIDGGMLKLPVAKRLSKAGYKKEHWLPVTFRVHEPMVKGSRRAR
jgi:hypothetical protein